MTELLMRDTHRPRRPLRVELWDAVNQACDTTGHTRAYWTGVVTGYQVAFGLLDRDPLDKARLAPGACVLNPLDPARLPFYADDETYWASGVLYGYKQGTSELPDADECLHCEQRLLDSDDTEGCEHGRFCFDHAAEWHAAPGAGLCRWTDDRRADA